jgi:DNA-binding transcriptional LysR family regulator
MGPSVPLSLRQVRVIVIRAQDDLERPRSAHQPGQGLNPARAGDEAEPWLRLTEDRGLPFSEAHVARQREFAASTTYAPFDLCNRDESACAQIAEQHGDRGLARQLRRLLPEQAVYAPLKERLIERVLPEWSGAHNILHLVYPTPRGMLPSVRSLIDYQLVHVPTLLKDRSI